MLHLYYRRAEAIIVMAPIIWGATTVIISFKTLCKFAVAFRHASHPYSNSTEKSESDERILAGDVWIGLDF